MGYRRKTVLLCRAVLAVIFVLCIGSVGSVAADDQEKEHTHELTDQHKQNVEQMPELPGVPANVDKTGAAEQHQELTHEQNVETMLELMGVPEQVNKVAADMLRLYGAKVDTGNTDPNIQKIVDAYHQAVRGVVNQVLGWDALKSTYINSYAKRLSVNEVAEVSGFLLSPGGQKFSDVQQEAAVDIQQTTKHLAEADMAPALVELASQLRAGLAKLQATQNPE